jgi:nicotinamidase-related amidase
MAIAIMVGLDLFSLGLVFYCHIYGSITIGMKMYTLVVVDMQSNFKAANGQRVRKNCVREILRAIKDNAPIIFLEWEGYPATLEDLTAPVKDDKYKNYYVKTKVTDDGSAQVASLVSQHKLPKDFKVCGVNTDCCVHATVVGLTTRFSKATITVIADACDSDWNHLSGLERLKSAENVKISKEEKHV